MARGATQIDEAGVPAQKWAPITTSNSAAQPDMRAVHCGGNAGTVVAGGNDSATASFYITQGGTLGLSPALILTSSTATGLVAIID